MRSANLMCGVLMLAACGDDGGGATDGPPGGPDAPPGTPDAPTGADAPPSVFDVSGTVIGPAVAAGPIAVGWPVATGADYIYKFGDGTGVGATFTAGLPGNPPAAARNIGGATTDFGVGHLMLLPPGTVLPEGMLASKPPLVGISARYAIIYRGAGDDGSLVPWTTAFPVGLSCGQCVDSPTTFDGWAPLACDTLVIDTDPKPDFCNWY